MNGMQSDPPGDQCVPRLATLCIWVSQMFCVWCLQKLAKGVFFFFFSFHFFFEISAEIIYESRGGHCYRLIFALTQRLGTLVPRSRDVSRGFLRSTTWQKASRDLLQEFNSEKRMLSWRIRQTYITSTYVIIHSVWSIYLDWSSHQQRRKSHVKCNIRAVVNLQVH